MSDEDSIVDSDCNSGPQEPQAWDAHDARRQRDQFAPPAEPCECYCLHCNRVFMSDQIWFQRIVNSKDSLIGFWMCPTPNCGGAGFTFDIFPTDPDHPANAGWSCCDDEDFDEDFDDVYGEIEFSDPDLVNFEPEQEYDPDEPRYKELDQTLAEDDDIEGEEWKYGLEPGELLPFSGPQFSSEEARTEWEEEQKRYDAPDQRPREIDWSDRDQGPASPINEDDIPF
jgi:hypothetical protein